MANKFDEIVALAKRRGFVYPSSEIYGGLTSVYDYGPLGVELLKNIKNLWWKTFVHQRIDVVGIESAIFMHPKVWEASGHIEGFHDPLIDCKVCKNRYRADHLLEEKVKDINPDELNNEELNELIIKNKIHCPNCGSFNWTKVRNFNLMFKTSLGAAEGSGSDIYLRPETAQGMFVQFRNVYQTSRVNIPFGIAQIGKAFRNEITKGKFIFRTLEFEQMELQFFIKESDWEKSFEDWRNEVEKWYNEILGIPKDNFRWKPHHPDKLAHYAKKAEDYEYKFSTGFGEVSGLHYRTDFDLTTHQKHSGEKLAVRDTKTGEEFIPHVIESTYGPNRNLMMVLDWAYKDEGDRKVLSLPSKLAPYKAAVFPLLANKEELVNKARGIYDNLSKDYNIAWDDRGNIGKRYFYQDEIGTPHTVTIDFDTLEDDTITIRDRDTTKQTRVAIDKISSYIQNSLDG